MTETNPDPSTDPSPGQGDDPWHIQWLRAQAHASSPAAQSSAAQSSTDTVPGANGEPWMFNPRPRRSRRRVALVVAGLLACAGIGLAIGLTRPSSKNAAVSTTVASPATAATVPTGNATTVASTASPATAETAGSTVVITTVASTTATTAATTAAPATKATPTTVAAPSTTAATSATSVAAGNLLDAVPQEHLPGGQLWPRGFYNFPLFHMQGTVPSQAVADDIKTRIGAIIGVENVVDETTKDPTVPIVKRVIVRIGNPVIFETDSDVIQADSVQGWNQWGLFLKANPKVTVTIIGHTDSRGSAEHNLDLSKRRAESAKARMVEVGVDPARIETIGKGDTDPIAENTSIGGMQQNRRIEVIVNNALG